jgi:hypothetical protein
MAADRPQPHMLMYASDGKPFFFEPHDPSLRPDEIIAQQINPGLFEPPPTMEELQNSAPVTVETQDDIDPASLQLPLVMQTPPPPLPDGADNPSAQATAPNSLIDFENLDGQEDAPPATSETAADEPVDLGYIDALLADMDNPAPSEAPAEPAADRLEIASGALTWAPSHGRVAIGIRVLQKVHEHTWPSPPDTFTYVQFQLNPWELHRRALARLSRYMVIPSRQKLREIMIAEGRGDEVPAMPLFVGAERLLDRLRTRR